MAGLEIAAAGITAPGRTDLRIEPLPQVWPHATSCWARRSRDHLVTARLSLVMLRLLSTTSTLLSAATATNVTSSTAQSCMQPAAQARAQAWTEGAGALGSPWTLPDAQLATNPCPGGWHGCGGFWPLPPMCMG